MKYCSKCGSELLDEAVICVRCDCATEEYTFAKQGNSVLITLIKVFMIVGTVASGFFLIPLAWCIPLTISYFNKAKNNLPISTGFKVCCLLFVNLIAGILMLCDDAS